jgi:hypothetical protein
MWWLNTNVSEDHAASIFRVEVHGERKVNIGMGKDMRRGRVKVGYSVSQQEALVEGVLGRV